MNRTARFWIALTLAHLAAACGAAPMSDATGAPMGEVPAVDAAPPGVDAGKVIQGGDAGAASSPDAAPPVPGPDAAPPPPVETPDAGKDAARGNDAAPPRVDAAPPAIDAAPPVVDAGTAPLCVPPPDGTCRGIGCPDYVAICNSINRTDTAIRTQLTGRSFECVDGARRCGSVTEDGAGPFTYPIVCRGSVWRFAVVEVTPGHWSPLFECSAGCGTAPRICTP